MKNNKPLISICLPAYNAAKFLPTCLKSIESQTYPKIELIAVDDGSVDGSYQILKQFAKGKNWVKVYKNSHNRGISPTFNLAISKAKSQFIARMDADDIMTPDRIDLQVKYLMENPDTIIVGGQCVIIDQAGQRIGEKTFPTKHSSILDMLFRTVPIQNPTIMINRNLLPSGFILNNPKFTPAEEFGLFYSAAKYGKLANLDQYIHYYREHTTNSSLKKPKQTFWRIWRTRLDAILNQNYKPSLHSLLVVTAQTIAIILLPEKVIYPLHKLMRGMVNKNVKLDLWPKTSPSSNIVSPLNRRFV